MPAELREFLLRCSVLPELTAARCAAVSGNADAAKLLDQIERRGLFVSVLEDAEGTLVLHDLFRDCLDDRLRREHPDEVPRLLQRAADGETDPVRRLSFLTRAGAWDEAERVFAQSCPALLSNGAIEQVLRLLEQFPADRRTTSPELLHVRGLAGWVQWDWPALIDAMHRAALACERRGDEAGRLRAIVYEAIGLAAIGRYDEAAALHATLPAEMPELEIEALASAAACLARSRHRRDRRGRAALRARARHHRGVRERLCVEPVRAAASVPWRAGHERAAQTLRRRCDAPRRREPVAAAHRGACRAGMARVVARRARRRDGTRRERASRRAMAGSPPNLRMFIHTFLAAAHAMRGDRDAAYRSVAVLHDYFESTAATQAEQRITSNYAHYVFHAVRIADTLADADGVRRFAAKLPGKRPIHNEELLRASLPTLPARLAALDNQHAKACEHWALARRDEMAIDIIGQANEARLRHARSLLALDRTTDAAELLRPVFDAVQAGGEIGGVLFAGARVLSALAGANWRGALDARQLSMLRQWARLLDARSAQGPTSKSPAVAPAAATAIDTLSAREREVLARMAAGDSNKLIARAFDLSPHTVKRHVANILDKLGVQTRGQAAAGTARASGAVRPRRSQCRGLRRFCGGGRFAQPQDSYVHERCGRMPHAVPARAWQRSRSPRSSRRDRAPDGRTPDARTIARRRADRTAPHAARGARRLRQDRGADAPDPPACRRTRALAWVSADEDDDLQRFLACLMHRARAA